MSRKRDVDIGLDPPFTSSKTTRRAARESVVELRHRTRVTFERRWSAMSRTHLSGTASERPRRVARCFRTSAASSAQ